MQKKSITKNTAYLTIRMLFLMVVNFYTSRVFLDKLGVEGYGIYTIVSSIAIAFAFFGSSLTNATQRFVTIELGKCNLRKANQIINLHFEVYAIITLVCLVIAEIAGIYLIQNKINIPIERIDAAIWVFQFALLSIAAQLISIPFEASVIAHEDMNLYSYMGIFEGVMRLLITFILSFVTFDKLILFSLLMCLVTVLSKSGFTIYAFRHYKECFIKYYWNLQQIKESVSFVGWNIVGTGRVAVITQGMDYVLNIFLGPVGNASRGITNQISGAIFSFSSNILVAAQPQMVKSYASDDKIRLNRLFYKTSLFSFYVLWVLICPMIFYIDYILDIWLIEVPKWASSFTFWQLLTSPVYVLTRPLWSIIIAVGRLKKYVIWDTITSVLSIPFAVLILTMDLNPEYVYIACFLVQILNTIVLLWVVNSYVEFGLNSYFRSVVLRLLMVTGISGLTVWIVSSIFNKSLVGILESYIMGFILVLAIIYLIGINKNDKFLICNKVKTLFYRLYC